MGFQRLILIGFLAGVFQCPPCHYCGGQAQACLSVKILWRSDHLETIWPGLFASRRAIVSDISANLRITALNDIVCAVGNGINFYIKQNIRFANLEDTGAQRLPEICEWTTSFNYYTTQIMSLTFLQRQMSGEIIMWKVNSTELNRV